MSVWYAALPCLCYAALSVAFCAPLFSSPNGLGINDGFANSTDKAATALTAQGLGLVAGIGLLAALGREGMLGSSLHAFGVSLPFTQAAVTVAVAYVASPLYIRQAIASFEATDPHLTAASRTLGAGAVRTFFRVVLPLGSTIAQPLAGGLVAGLALSFARGLGEFGATIMFAGSLQGVTQTLPLAIYAEFDQNFDAALAMSGVLIVISAALLLTLRIGLSWQRSPSTRSPSLFGISGSA